MKHKHSLMPKSSSRKQSAERTKGDDMALLPVGNSLGSSNTCLPFLYSSSDSQANRRVAHTPKSTSLDLKMVWRISKEL